MNPADLARCLSRQMPVLFMFASPGKAGNKAWQSRKEGKATSALLSLGPVVSSFHTTSSPSHNHRPLHSSPAPSTFTLRHVRILPGRDHYLNRTWSGFNPPERPAVVYSTVSSWVFNKRTTLLTLAPLCPGYKAINANKQGLSFTADLTLNGDPCNAYGEDLQDLKLLVEYQDADEDVYQVPHSVIPRPSTDGNHKQRQPSLRFDYQPDPFSFRVLRQTDDSDEQVLIDTTETNLIFETQYLNLRTWPRTLWSRDAYGVPSNTNLYGNGVFFLNSNVPGDDEGQASVDTYFPDDIFYDWTTGAAIHGHGANIKISNIAITDISIHTRGSSVLPLRSKSAMTTKELRTRGFEVIIAPNLDHFASGESY
ncbi:alpha/beta-glucosidase agdC [Penicillium cinerascens]|uniref:Alpha/beta-glucosidase agdC n=1 Tax=Penicillium cinerascens TaxID=70096 RepID=A0A9W9MPA8_9EURO|nr:alpha/beta-glucosidase agdC [Penicillium cinerascens]KAJ5204969.1 alpha/beta-glucosidase agdC [Penicillium cinerascens]